MAGHSGPPAGAGLPEPYLKDPNTNQDAVAPEGPADSISCLAWSATQDLLAAGAWDNTVRVWEVRTDGSSGSVFGGGDSKLQISGLRTAIQHEAPVLCCGFSRDGQQLVSAGCDKKVRVRDLQAQRDVDLGQHDAPVKEIFVLDDLKLVATGSWDKTLMLWSSQQPTPVKSLKLPERVYTMDVKFPLLVVGCADRIIQTFDLNQLAAGAIGPSHQFSSPLKMQTRSLSIFPDRSGFVLGSVEGRGAVRYIENESRNFSFKCHRSATSISSVNCVDFHPALNSTFATSGSDGQTFFWDKDKKVKLHSFSSCHYPITACRFNSSGSLFAYAVSYDWSQGHEAFHPNLPRQVLVHQVKQAELEQRR